MLDQADLQILQLLKENARLNWKEIGKQVHLTGQAVGNRIRRLEEIGIVEEYTVTLNQSRLGRPITAFINVFVETSDHKAFQQFFESENAVADVHRISGEGCYLLTAHFATSEELDQFLGKILEHGNYRVSLSIGKLKPSLKKVEL